MNINDGTGQKIKCYICQEDHTIFNCEIYKGFKVPERWSKVKELRLCFSCLHKGHGSSDCKSRKICEKKDCGRYHHQSLHDDKPKGQEKGERIASTKVLKCNTQPSKQLFKVLPVQLFGPGGRKIVYGLIDEGSAVTLIDAEIAKKLGLKGRQLPLTLQWYGDKFVTEPSTKLDLEIASINGQIKFAIKQARTIRGLELPRQSFNKSNYAHLQNLPIHNYDDVQPAILIGLDNAHLCAVTASVSVHNNQPIAIETKLGWIAYGRGYGTSMEQTPSLHVHAVNPRDDLHDIAMEYFAADNFGVSDLKGLESDDNQKARRIMENSVQRVPTGFEIGLLWKEFPPDLPDSFECAKRRFLSLERKMQRDDTYGEMYKKEIEKYIKKGYARKLEEHELGDATQPLWFLPHFGVQSPHKPGKLRVVFDAAAMVNGVSLNSVLLKGPEQAKFLLGILFKFRQGAVAVAADIREMFSQIKIRSQDQNAQRFLWRYGDVQQPIGQYLMTSMIFGAICSPCCAEFIKNSNAEEFREKYPDAVAKVIENHYVDDFVCSFTEGREAIEICRQVIEIQAHAGFELRGFISNSDAVIRELNENETPDPGLINLEKHSTTEKVLGMYWNYKTDHFEFHTKFHRIPNEVLMGIRPPTKREMLGIVMAVYDPFGLVADFMVHSKILIRETWKAEIGWDEYIPDTIARTWYTWWRNFQNTIKLKVPRHYSVLLNGSSETDLHVFVDASQDAFAAVAYFRIQNKEKTEVVFVAGKTRGAPRKLMSIPRLELQAAVLGVRLYKLVCKNHNIVVRQSWFWSDSQTVLSWIKSRERKYKAFVAHRVAEILSTTEDIQCRWVPTQENSADAATRANYAPSFTGDNKWLSGPDFLKTNKWPKATSVYLNAEDEEEYVSCHLSRALQPTLVDYSRFSTYNKLRRSFAWVIRALREFRILHGKERRNGKRKHLSIYEIKDAEKQLCKLVQREEFIDDLNIINNNKVLKKTSCLYLLNAYLDTDNLLRVSGRIDEALYLPLDTRRPIILPKTHIVSKLIIKHFHEKNFHQNHSLVLYQIRQRFWILGAKQTLKSIVHHCVICQMERAQPKPPQMGQLPADRLTPYVRPFAYTGVDLFGPLTVTIGRRREKRWAVIFTCMTIRAAHIELAASLSTDSFLVCLRNFINRRGTPVRIRSDNGTNFIGAQKDLKNDQQMLNIDQIVNESSQHGIEWIFNCPSNLRSGGCWERLIRIVKRLLHHVLKDEAPRVELLQAVLIEAEIIINSRPLTDVPISSEEDQPLTPNDFLMGCANTIQTPAIAQPLCIKKQWNILQNMKIRLWKRWTNQYLPQLLRRQKWNDETKPILVGDIVLICDSNMPRYHWMKGKVIAVFPGKDGRIRTVELKTTSGILRRPVSKLIVLYIGGKSCEDLRGAGCCGSTVNFK